ncbi:MAG: hypothetical protein ACRESZ_01640 [Methylococcales bacterium]
MTHREVLSCLPSLPSFEIVDDGYALFEDGSLNLVFCNATFRHWLDVQELGIRLDKAIVEINPATLLKRLDKRGRHSLYLVPRTAGRAIPNFIEVLIRRTDWEGGRYIIVHLHDASTIQEKDALIESHSRMIEQSHRKLQRFSEQLEEDNRRLQQAMADAREARSARRRL